MAQTARGIMTPDPACCTPNTPLDQVARMMLQNDCGEIPVVDVADELVGVVTDRDIVCRVVAAGKNPIGYTAKQCMSHPVITVHVDDVITQVLETMEHHQIRRVPVVDDGAHCVGIIAQADIAWVRRSRDIAELIREVSRDATEGSRR